MIKESLFTLSQKIKLYRRLLMLFLAVNVFSCVTSIVLSISYWQGDLSHKKELIYIGALTFLFGILLPGLISYLLFKALKTAQRLFIESVRSLVADWRQAVESGGPEPFKNMQFWVETLLILSHHLGRQVDHPLVQIGGDLAGLIQHELKIARNKNAA
jgi:hypothetical protein